MDMLIMKNPIGMDTLDWTNLSQLTCPSKEKAIIKLSIKINYSDPNKLIVSLRILMTKIL